MMLPRSACLDYIIYQYKQPALVLPSYSLINNIGNRSRGIILILQDANSGKNRDWVQYCSLKEKDAFIWECDNLLSLSPPRINSRRVEEKAAMNRRTPKYFASLSEQSWDWVIFAKQKCCLSLLFPQHATNCS